MPLAPTPKARLLKAQFFNRSIQAVAEDLIGGYLWRKVPHSQRLEAHLLTEIEIYDGKKDQACHAYKGKTARNEALFGVSGRFYVYLCYGVHWMLNIVTGPVNYPAGILIRSAGLIQGPGRLSRALLVDGKYNHKPAKQATGLWFSAGLKAQSKEILKTPRIGVQYADSWAKKPYRYVLGNAENLPKAVKFTSFKIEI